MTMKNAAFVIAISLAASTTFLSVPASAAGSYAQTRDTNRAATRNFNAGYEAGLRGDGIGIRSRSYNRGYSDAANGLGYYPRGYASYSYARSDDAYGNPDWHAPDIHTNPANL